MNILIIGSTGFIGKLLKFEIKKKHSIASINYKKKDKYTLFLDLKNLLKKKNFIKVKNFKPDVLIDCSWTGIPNFSKKNCEKNYLRTKLLVKKINQLNSLKKIIFLGSCAEYKMKIMKSKIKENYKLIDKSKNLSSYKNRIRSFVFKNINEEKKLLWLRLFYVFGKGQRNGSLIKYIEFNKKIIINTPNYIIDFINSVDVVKIIKKFIKADLVSGIYNLGSGNGFKIKDLCQKLVKNKKKEIIYKNLNSKKKYMVANMNKTLTALNIKKKRFIKII